MTSSKDNVKLNKTALNTAGHTSGNKIRVNAVMRVAPKSNALKYKLTSKACRRVLMVMITKGKQNVMCAISKLKNPNGICMMLKNTNNATPSTRSGKTISKSNVYSKC